MDNQPLDAIVISHMHADHFFDLVPLRYALKYGDDAFERVPLWLPPGGRTALAALRNAVSPDAAEDFFEPVYDVREYDPAAPLEIKDLHLSFARTLHYIEGYAVRLERGDASLTYSADTAPCDAIVGLAQKASLFLCEASLGLGTEEGKRGHCSAYEAGEMAQRAHAERLLLTHYPAAVPTEALIEAAQSRFSGRVSAARDGAELVIEKSP
jgi:ribonuclease BN (tRNA processing enzyme)